MSSLKNHRGQINFLVVNFTDCSRTYTRDRLSSRAGSVCSMDSFPVLSRASSRNMERDWDNGSIASSITSVEYSGEHKCSHSPMSFRDSC